MLRSYKAREISIGSVVIGGNNPVALQSMTNTDTLDVVSTVEQVKRLYDAGCSFVRVTTPTMEHAKSLAKIKDVLHKQACFVPLVADVHFLPSVALFAAEIVEKVRINPGNYVDKHIGKIEYTLEEHKDAISKTTERILPLIEVCKKNNTVLRLGVNQGSISERIVSTYGHTSQALVYSAMEFVGICESQNFYNIVLSMKSSSVKRMREAVLMAVKIMQERERSYPLHIGVTEAGNGMDGRLISAVGIGSLLKAGIGDTIRVSLTERPEKEIPVASSIVHWAEYFSSMNEGIKDFDFSKIEKEEIAIAAAVALGDRMMDGEDGFDIKNIHISDEDKETLLKDIYQAAEAKFYKTHFIACPSCGRTLYNIEDVLEKVKSRFSDYKGITIAVMGCIVNGPGEMADADYGYIGSGNGLVNLYKKGKLVEKNIPEKKALDALEMLINR